PALRLAALPSISRGDAMRAKVLLSLALAAIAGTAVCALEAQKPGKAAATSRLNVFSPTVYAVEPNIEVGLQLTEEQKQKIAKAVEETVQAPAVVELKPKKGEPADKAKQAKLKEEMAKAQAGFKKRVADILTPEQKATIQKVDEAMQQALDSVLT